MKCFSIALCLSSMLFSVNLHCCRGNFFYETGPEYLKSKETRKVPVGGKVLCGSCGRRLPKVASVAPVLVVVKSKKIGTYKIDETSGEVL